MPGQLQHNAACPCCETPLEAIVDTSNTAGMTREYFHQKGFDGRDAVSMKCRRKKRCVRRYTDHAEAARDRKALEVCDRTSRRK
jgi:hypothetical protein